MTARKSAFKKESAKTYHQKKTSADRITPTGIEYTRAFSTNISNISTPQASRHLQTRLRLSHSSPLQTQGTRLRRLSLPVAPFASMESARASPQTLLSDSAPRKPLAYQSRPDQSHSL